MLTKKEVQDRLNNLLKEVEELQKIIAAPEKTKEERFLELIKGEYSVKYDPKAYPNSIFFFKDGKYFAEYDTKNRYLWLSYSKIWSVFKKEDGLSYSEIQSFVKNQVEKHFNLGNVIPADNIKYFLN